MSSNDESKVLHNRLNTAYRCREDPRPATNNFISSSIPYWYSCYIMTYPLDKLCLQTLKFDRRIRYASVLDDTGRIIAGGMRKGISSLEPVSEDLRLMANLTIQIGTDKTWDRYFGIIQYTFVKREKVNMLTFNLGVNFMLISTEPDFDLHQVANLRETVLTIYTTGMIPERTR